MSFKMQSITFILLLSSLSLAASAASNDPKRQRHLSSQESDPEILGYMKGFPPSADKLIMQPESNFFSFPKMRWSVCHIRELMPTEEISRGLGSPSKLQYALDTKIDSLEFMPLNATKTMTWIDSLAANYTDAILIMHKDKVIYEKYFGCMSELQKHAAMSMTKSITGLLAEILVAEGRLDETALVGSLLPPLKNSAFGSATVRQLMDMTTSLAFNENYSDRNADIWNYSAAASPLPKPKSYKGPNGYFEYLKTIKKAGKHGEAFGYRTVNSDALGWIISKVSGKKVTQILSERIWSKMGAEQDAYMTVDALGTPFAGGGLSAGLRDMGRIGQLMLNEGAINGVQLFPKKVVENIRAGGDKEAFSKAKYQTLRGGSYRSMWWVLHNKNNSYAARGVHGQTLYVDPTAEMVIVRFASYPDAQNSKIDPTSLPAFQAVADYLTSTQAR